MALSDKRKERLRLVLRATMVTLAALLLLVAIAIPIANNAIALGVENRLKDLPMPEGARQISSVSVAGDLTKMGVGMQYYGAILIQSDLPKEQIVAHYSVYRQGLMDCIVEDASGAQTTLSSLPLADVEPAFAADAIQEDYYLVYSWGDAPDWLRDILNLDTRSR